MPSISDENLDFQIQIIINTLFGSVCNEIKIVCISNQFCKKYTKMAKLVYRAYT